MINFSVQKLVYSDFFKYFFITFILYILLLILSGGKRHREGCANTIQLFKSGDEKGKKQYCSIGQSVLNKNIASVG